MSKNPPRAILEFGGAANDTINSPTQMAEAPVARLDEMNNRLGAMVQAVKNLRPTLATFYASLSDEHNAQFNTMGQQNVGNTNGGRQE
jgi:hypothetical protein